MTLYSSAEKCLRSPKSWRFPATLHCRKVLFLRESCRRKSRLLCWDLSDFRRMEEFDQGQVRWFWERCICCLTSFGRNVQQRLRFVRRARNRRDESCHNRHQKSLSNSSRCCFRIHSRSKTIEGHQEAACVYKIIHDVCRLVRELTKIL